MRQTVFEPAWLDELASLRGTLTSAQLAEGTAGVAFPAAHVHRVRNIASLNATSVNAYSPPRQPMREYLEMAGAAAKVDELLTKARAKLARLRPHEAAEALERGALLVDIRPEAQR